MNQDKKQKIAAALKTIMPKDWKYSLAVRHNSTIVCTIKAAPINLIHTFRTTNSTHYVVNPYHYKNHIKNQTVLDTIINIMDCLNLDNHDDSDPVSDYFDVGHYVELQFGTWDKPFKETKS